MRGRHGSARRQKHRSVRKKAGEKHGGDGEKSEECLAGRESGKDGEREEGGRAVESIQFTRKRLQVYKPRLKLFLKQELYYMALNRE